MKKLLVLMALAWLAGCGKHDVIAPVITLNSPSDNQVIANGQTVSISAHIQDENDIHMVHVIVTDNSGNHIIHFEEHLDGRYYDLNKSFTGQAGKNYSIHVDATDHADNLAQKDCMVTCN